MTQKNSLFNDADPPAASKQAWKVKVFDANVISKLSTNFAGLQKQFSNYGFKQSAAYGKGFPRSWHHPKFSPTSDWTVIKSKAMPAHKRKPAAAHREGEAQKKRKTSTDKESSEVAPLTLCAAAADVNQMADDDSGCSDTDDDYSDENQSDRGTEHECEARKEHHDYKGNCYDKQQNNQQHVDASDSTEATANTVPKLDEHLLLLREAILSSTAAVAPTAVFGAPTAAAAAAAEAAAAAAEAAVAAPVHDVEHEFLAFRTANSTTQQLLSAVTKQHESEKATAVAAAAALAGETAQLAAVDERLADLETEVIKLRQEQVVVAARVADAKTAVAAAAAAVAATAEFVVVTQRAADAEANVIRHMSEIAHSKAATNLIDLQHYL
jgi:hypothetical protein